MRKKSEAQCYLEQVEKLEAVIMNKLIERQQWYDLALGITANMEGERVQASGAQSKMSDAVNRCVDMEAEIDSLVYELVNVKRDVVATIEKLEIPMEYNVLHKRYIQFKTLQEIADEYNRDYGWAATTQGRALAHVQEILQKQNETFVRLCD